MIFIHTDLRFPTPHKQNNKHVMTNTQRAEQSIEVHVVLQNTCNTLLTTKSGARIMNHTFRAGNNKYDDSTKTMLNACL